MPMATKPRIKLPESATVGEVIEIKALINHVMETGNRKDTSGNRIPRNIIHTLSASYAGNLVFKADFGSGISANPYLAFYLKVPGPGVLELTWIDDEGGTTVETAPLNIV
jgi:sulfur-oxidizing protein SoxZ